MKYNIILLNSYGRLLHHRMQAQSEIPQQGAKVVKITPQVEILLNQLEFSWKKAKELIPQIFIAGISEGMTSRAIRKAIQERIDLTPRQIRNLTPDKYKELRKRNGKAGTHQPRVEPDFQAIADAIATVLKEKKRAKTQIEAIIKILQENRLV